MEVLLLFLILLSVLVVGMLIWAKLDDIKIELRYNNVLRDKSKETIRKGADVSNFGDPLEWQKQQREDRDI